MTELADRLQRAGLIARTRSSSDRRLVVLRPTARGRRTIERVLAPLLAGIAGAVQTLGEDQLVVVGSFLGDVERVLAAIAPS